MATERTITISDGHLRFIYSDDLADLLAEGKADVRRVSHVEYDNQRRGWTADMSPLELGVLLGPYSTRQEALNAEREWIAQHRGL